MLQLVLIKLNVPRFSRMDKDETLKINYDEFREYLLLHPSSNIWDIVHYWRHASVSNFSNPLIYIEMLMAFSIE